MRRTPSSEPSPISTQPRNDWQTILSLLPYLATYKWRVGFALSCLIGAKVANLGVPIVMKRIVDGLASVQHLTALGRAHDAPGIVLLGGIGLLVVAYAVVRLSTSLFTELREILFSKVTESAVRQLALKVFRHLHALSLRFHLERQTGGMSRDIERGTRGITQLISYSLYSILPTLVEVGLVLGFFVVKYEAYYAVVTFIALAVYIVFTVKVTEWRTHFRRTMNDLDSQGQFARDRFAAQLRDRQIFRQRRMGSAAVTTKICKRYRDGGDQVAELAVGAELRSAGDHRHGARVHSVARHAGRDGGAPHARRSGADQYLHAAALHSAEFSRRGVSRTEAEPDRHGPHVHAARRAAGSAGCARRAGARACAARRCASSM